MALSGRLGSTTDAYADSAAPMVLGAAAAGLTDFIGAQGGDIDAIFGNCHVSPDMTDAPTLQLPLVTFCNLFEEAARRTGHDNFGLSFGQQFQPRDLGMWGYAALSSPTLGSALESLVDLFRYQQSSSIMRFLPDDEKRMRLEYQIQAPSILARRQDAELSLGQFTNLVRECCGRNWSPFEIQFEHPRPANWHQHEKDFGAPVFFDCASNAIIFDRELLDRPMPASDHKLHTMMRTCLELLGSPDISASPFDLISNAIRRRLADGSPTLEEIANAVQIAPATITRVLADEGLGFREAVDAIRYDLARLHLRQRYMPLSEIALILGYSELSAFTRAFTRWSGISPRGYRKSLTQH